MCRQDYILVGENLRSYTVYAKFYFSQKIFKKIFFKFKNEKLKNFFQDKIKISFFFFFFAHAHTHTYIFLVGIFKKLYRIGKIEKSSQKILREKIKNEESGENFLGIILRFLGLKFVVAKI